MRYAKLRACCACRRLFSIKKDTNATINGRLRTFGSTEFDRKKRTFGTNAPLSAFFRKRGKLLALSADLSPQATGNYAGRLRLCQIPGSLNFFLFIKSVPHAHPAVFRL
jgi:hypothetical protein